MSVQIAANIDPQAGLLLKIITSGHSLMEADKSTKGVVETDSYKLVFSKGIFLKESPHGLFQWDHPRKNQALSNSSIYYFCRGNICKAFLS